MNLKEELQQKHYQQLLDEITSDIRSSRSNIRYYKVPLQEGIDVKHKWIFSYRLVGYGQLAWDKLVSLGFKPQFTWGGGWAGPPGIIVRW